MATWTPTQITPYDDDTATESIGIGNIAIWGARINGAVRAYIGNGHSTTRHTTAALRDFARQALALADAIDAEAARKTLTEAAT
ncbi:hypothetical protein [Kineosporia sp. NBRC 101731]|uniref:hypothetical protein n=1 Tax=Kineosporia sp. NBRC 101731 TaxID=3032199 RepID=UPI0024A05450|nr:hypothetical protein [Kineosporia sp. NBRC 101731]GLY32073.1 hypothetical protein Kisp02_54380 [Kineosporia sp. NBRC 101731]